MFDINTAIGHWPFRRLAETSAAGLAEHLSGFGIAGAAVVNTHGLFYKNCHDANLELAESLEPHRECLVGIATLNPHYPAWERDLCACVHDLGFRGVRLAPQYHDYTLGDSACLALVHAACTLGVPVFVPSRVVDIRQRHWLDTERTVGLSEVTALCAAAPDARIVFTEFPAVPVQLCDSSGAPRWPNLYVEVSRMRSAYGQVLAALVHAVGASNVLFGSGAPFKEVEPAVLKLQCADLTEEQREAVGAGSARRLLGLSPCD